MTPGAVIADRFLLASVAGSGGMGTVFRGVDTLDGSAVAVKMLRAQDGIEVERFEREAAVLAELRHPGIVRYVAHGATRTGERYLAMEWLEGEDLGSRIRGRRLSVPDSLRVMRRAAAALGFAHDRGLVHRDVKPSNIFIVGGDVDQIRLVDFGIAHVSRERTRLTGTGIVLGTPGYIAPEQLESHAENDARVDVFSMGCVLFECLTGRAAFEGAHLMAVLTKILFQETPRVRDVRPDLPEPLDALVARMMAKAPGDRPADGRAVERELEALGEVDFGPPSSGVRPAPAASSDRLAVSLTHSEQRLVTVVFAGNPDADPLLRGERATPELASLLDAYGGQLTELPGRSILVTQWGTGSAVDRAERAAQCALLLRAHLPGVSICVATGRGLVSARVIEGEIIDRGVRTLARTRPGVIELDEVSAGMIEARVRVAHEGGVHVLRGERVAPGGTQLLGKPSAFVGRTREMSTLDGVLSGAISEPVASAVLVIGGAGSGKSRLRREFLERVQARPEHVEIVTGRADSLCPGTPYGIVADAVRNAAGIRDGEPIDLRQRKLIERFGGPRRERESGAPGRERDSVAPFLGELIGARFPDQDDKALRAARENAMLMGDAMRAAWEAWLERECHLHPVLLVLEDLHWADAASVRLIDSTLRNLSEQPLMVLVLARPEVTAQFPGLWAARDVQTIKLGPLARKSAEKLVRDALGPTAPAPVLTRVLDRADGNPFYLEELVRAVVAGRGDVLPDSVLGTVEARLDAEGGEAKRVLRAASVFGDRFSRSAVAWLLGGDVEKNDVGAWLDALASHELVTPASGPAGDTGYVFRHTLVREAAYAMLTDSDRELGHRLAGEWLERHGSADATALAEHFRRGGEPGRAVRWYRRAAEQALEANELGAAIEQAERGVACGAAGEDLGHLRLVEAEANVWRGELGLAEERAHEATQLLLEGSPAWFRAFTQVIIVAIKLSTPERVDDCVTPVLRAKPADAEGPRLVCLGWAALALILGGRYNAADALLETLGGEVQDHADLAGQAVAILEQARAVRALYAGDLAVAVAGLTAALAALEETGDRRNACAVRSNLGYCLAGLGDFPRAEVALRAVLGDADRLGLPDATLTALHNLGPVVAYCGRLDEARTLELRAAEALERQGDLRIAGAARTYLATIALLSGDPQTAEREARAAMEALNVAPPLRVAAVANLARALLAEGRAADALPVAREAFEALEAMGMIEEGESLVRLVHAEALAAVGLEAEFHAAIASAREHLLARAAKISDPEWRRRFLTAVPDNARTLALSGGYASVPPRGDAS